MGLLRSVIADARSGKSWNSPSVLAGQQTRGGGEGATGVGSTLDSRGGVATAPGRQGPLYDRGLSGSPLDRRSEFASGPAPGGATKHPVAIAQSRIGMDNSSKEKGTGDDSPVDGLSAGRSRQQGGDTLLPQSEPTAGTDESLAETHSSTPFAKITEPVSQGSVPDFQQLTSETDASEGIPVSVDEQVSVSGYSPDLTDNPVTDSGEKSNSRREVSTNVSATRQPVITPHQAENQGHFEVKGDRRDSAAATVVEPFSRQALGASDAVSSTPAMDSRNKEEPFGDDAASSGNIPFDAEIPPRVGSPEAKSDRQITTQMPLENRNRMSVDLSDSPQREQPDSEPLSFELDSNDPPTRPKVSDESKLVRKDAAVSTESANVTTTKDSAPEPRPPSPAVRSELESVLSDFAVQPRSAAVQARVLPGKPVSDHGDRYIANTATGEPIDVPRTTEVKIGQVDVFVEGPHRINARGSARARPSTSLASRHYLRRF